MEYAIKVEVVGDYELRATGFMDDVDSVLLSGGGKVMSAEEVVHGATLIEVARRQIAILRAAEEVTVEV